MCHGPGADGNSRHFDGVVVAIEEGEKKIKRRREKERDEIPGLWVPWKREREREREGRS